MTDSLADKTYIAGAYVRLSIEDNNKDIESGSITNQKSFIKNYALENNIYIYDYYIDDGYSGGSFDRPGFKKLIDDIENGIINCVITKDMSRLGREFIETGNYVFKYFPENNIRYIAILDNYDALNPNGMDDILPFKAVINDMYLKDISRKIKSVRHEKMKEGLFVGSSVPYGYKRSDEDSRMLVIDEYAAEIVKRIFDMKNNGLTEGLIAKTLTKEGILPPDVYKGRKLKHVTVTTNLWKTSSIKTILKNEAYIGNLIQGKYERVSLKSKKKRLLPKSKWIVKNGVIPPIISQELFTKVNQVKEKSDTRFRQYEYLLKGLVACADCGKTMLVRRVKNQYDSTKFYAVYACRTYANYNRDACSMHYYREEVLNELIIKSIRSLLLKYSQIEKLKQKYQSLICNFNLLKKSERELVLAKSEILTINKAISELYIDRAKNIITEEEFYRIKRELINDKNENKSKSKKIEFMREKCKNIVTDDKLTMKYINDFLEMKTPNKEVIKILVKKIEINEDKSIKIYFNFGINEGNNG